MNKQNSTCSVCGTTLTFFLSDLFDNRYGAPGKYSIYKCNGCGFGRINPVIDRNKIGEFYAKYYPLGYKTAEQVKIEASVKPKWLAWLTGTNNTAHWLIKPKSMVLDIGSASGVSLLEINQLEGEAYGVEPDPNAQKIAEKLKLQVFQGFITDNPFPGKEFDFITASQVIEHEPDPKMFFKAVFRHLNEEGKVILSFPNSDSFYRKIFKRGWINWHIPYHLNYFTQRSFSILVEQSGFQIVKIKTVTPNIWTLLQLRVLFSKIKEGEKNPIWSINQTKYLSNRKESMRAYQEIIIKAVFILMMIPITILNRLVDLFGQGDSFLVILKKNEN